MRYPLIDSHELFGSIDGDGQRRCVALEEAGLAKLADEMTLDIGKDTVDFAPNFDETEKEAVVMPSRFPNLLANGTAA